MKYRVLIVSHCFLNDAVKLMNQDVGEQANEKKLKQEFLQYAIREGIELVQLPCPEFLIYGSLRWGHAVSQFDNPFFRDRVDEMLKPIILQIKEYLKYPERFEMIGILGIDGSPSCGVNFTYDGEWGGEFYSNTHLEETFATMKRVNQMGILMDEFKLLLEKESIEIPFYGLENYPYQNKFHSMDNL